MVEALGEVGKNAASKAKERLSRRSRVQEDFNASDSGEEGKAQMRQRRRLLVQVTETKPDCMYYWLSSVEPYV